MKLTKKDMDKILSKYSLGKFKRFGGIMKDDSISFGQVIYTDKKEVFMKVFKSFDTSIKQGLIVSAELYNKGFPTYKTYETKDNKKFLTYKNKKIAFFEYLSIGRITEWKDLSTKQIKDFAKQLAIFHKFTSRKKLKATHHGGYNEIKELIKKSYKIRNRYNNKIKKAIVFMNEKIKTLKYNTREKKTGYFSEFNPGHVIFKGDKIKWVIDWEIGYDYRFYDFGSSLVACFNEKTKRLSYRQIRIFINSYNSTQKLSKWEREHIYEGFLFGVFKYGVWELIDLKTGDFAKNSRKVDMSNINKVLYTMNIDKTKFTEKIR